MPFKRPGIPWFDRGFDFDAIHEVSNDWPDLDVRIHSNGKSAHRIVIQKLALDTYR